ncbi:MAG: hypothetical protein LBU90_03070 [Bacteroidales bacterium]|nr:hypothetical protein [Bacteroidales bacterium]
MKNYISFFCALTLFVACNTSKTTPVVFALQRDEVSIRLQLNHDSTFDYKAHHERGVAFHEAGRFTTTDTTLILKYTNPSYSYNCFTVPLENDTFLFVTYKEQLYLVHSNQPSEEQRSIFLCNLQKSIENHTFNLFEEDLYLPLTEGDIRTLRK